MTVQHLQRPVDPAGKGQADPFERRTEFLDHGGERITVDRLHLADLFGERGLQVIGQPGERQVRPFRQQETHDHRRLLPSGQGVAGEEQILPGRRGGAGDGRNDRHF